MPVISNPVNAITKPLDIKQNNTAKLADTYLQTLPNSVMSSETGNDEFIKEQQSFTGNLNETGQTQGTSVLDNLKILGLKIKNNTMNFVANDNTGIFKGIATGVVAGSITYTALSILKHAKMAKFLGITATIAGLAGQIWNANKNNSSDIQA